MSREIAYNNSNAATPASVGLGGRLAAEHALRLSAQKGHCNAAKTLNPPLLKAALQDPV
jgi:hypothetical protein